MKCHEFRLVGVGYDEFHCIKTKNVVSKTYYSVAQSTWIATSRMCLRINIAILSALCTPYLPLAQTDAFVA